MLHFSIFALCEFMNKGIDVPMSENKIILSLKNDSRDAFNQLFRFYYPKVAAYVASLIGNEMVAEDVAQDVFLYVWENRKKLTVEAGFHSYLFQTAYSRSIDYFRKSRHTQTVDEQLLISYMEDYGSMLRNEEEMLKNLYSKDFYKELYRLLDEMPAERKEVFILAYLKGMKAREISGIKEIPKRTVESHLYLAMKYLKRKMSENDFFTLLLLILTSSSYN